MADKDKKVTKTASVANDKKEARAPSCAWGTRQT